MQILTSAFVILEVLALFNVLIFVHELGHFLAAKWRGLKIERFAIWFGTPIWKKKINGVEYALGTIPAGGYVSLPQMAPMDIIEGKSEKSAETLPPISPLDKIIVAMAGPLFSFLLALAFAFLVWGVGRPEPKDKDSTVIGWADPDGPATKAGLKPGDKIVAIDGQPVTTFAPPSQDSITWRIVTSEGDSIAITYLRDGKESTVNVVPVKKPTKWYERKSLRKILVLPAHPAIVGDVATNSPAAAAGLRKDDEVIAFNGEKVYSPQTILAAEDKMTNNQARNGTFTILRNGKQMEISLVAKKPETPAEVGPMFGIIWLFNEEEVLVHPRPFDQVSEAAGQIFGTLKTVLSRKSDVGFQQLGGPVMIIRAYKNFIDSENGWRRVLWFSVILNVNLALLNMLPFPVLDGGHITLAILDAIRRRPTNARLLNALQTSCAMILIAFMLFIGFLDVGDWVRSAHQEREQPIVFSPGK